MGPIFTSECNPDLIVEAAQNGEGDTDLILTTVASHTRFFLVQEDARALALAILGLEPADLEAVAFQRWTTERDARADRLRQPAVA